MKEINFVTGNQFKLYTARSFLEPYGITVNQIKMDCPELQLDSIEEVAMSSARFAWEELQIPVMKNDTGLIIPALNGFPGPYTKYVEETITEDGILSLLEGKGNREAYFLEVFVFVLEDGTTKTFVSKTEGIIALEKSGNYGWGYDRIFIPKGHDKTLAHFLDEERGTMWSVTAYEEIISYITKGEI